MKLRFIVINLVSVFNATVFSNIYNNFIGITFYYEIKVYVFLCKLSCCKSSLFLLLKQIHIWLTLEQSKSELGRYT